MIDGETNGLREAWDCLSAETLERVAECARRQLQVATARLSFFESDRWVVRATAGSMDASSGEAICRRVWTERAPVVIDDVGALASVAALEPPGRSTSYAGVPLRSSGGMRLGVLDVADASARQWRGEDVALLEDLALCVAGQVEAHLELVRAKRAVTIARSEHDGLLTLLDNMSGVVFERRKTGSSRSDYTIFGSRKAALPAVLQVMEGGEAGALDFIHRDDRQLVRDALHRSLSEESDLQLVFRIADQDRSVRWIRTSLVRRRETAGPATWNGVAFDVTDLIVAQENAATAQAGRETAIVNANHELRTPLQAIIGFSAFMKGETRPEVMADHAKAIQSAADSLLSIVNQQLDLAGGTLEVTPTATSNVALRPFAETCLSLVGPLALEKDLIGHLVIDPDVPGTVAMDAQKVQQAILNLLNNAVKYTTQGSFTLSIARAMDGLRFSVADTGIGVPEEKRALLFQRFSRLQGTDAVSGSGLGLSITKAIVQALHGRIGIGDTPGRGATFWFEIPVAVAAEDGAFDQDVTGSDLRGDEGADETGARILLADDLDLNRRLIADLLAIEGHRVDCVADGAAAVKMAAENVYDLILMDMIMPGMDGIAATRAIRALPAPSCAVPIVALTANSFREQLDSCLTAGMDATLTKPMSVDALTRAVQTWTRGRKAA